jgi:hypothetical protein
MKKVTCEERIERELAGRLSDLRKLWTAYTEGDEDRYSDELGNIFEYGLCFSYVPGEESGSGYFRYQISCGGPAHEFRFYCDERFRPIRVEYWFLDWFDGAHRTLTGADENLLKEIFEWFREIGSVQEQYEKMTRE